MTQPRPFYVDMNYGIIHEDNDLLVVDKPAPLPVHSVGSYGVLNLLDLIRKEIGREQQELRTPHRLDSETSGVLLFAKSLAAARDLGIQFTEGKVRKTYLAIVFGAPAETEGELDAPLGKDPANEKFVVRILDPEGEPARTRYRMISTNGRYSILELEPLTGRTHQLRVHCAILGCPIVGDKIYPDPSWYERYVRGGLNDDLLAALKLPRLALHANRIRFRHPGTGEEVGYSADLPTLLEDFIQAEGIRFPAGAI